MTENENMTFESFNFHEGIVKALVEAEFKTPSSIQQEVIPHILAGRDLIGQAQTGTGKTGAFGLPALHLLQKNPGTQMLVMTPTRELAKQVSDELHRFSRHIGIKSVAIFGGSSFRNQIEALQRGVQIIVATPGRLLDLLQSDKIPNLKPAIVVLDEADEMLDMGFLDDITHIFQFLPEKRQTLLFSATMPLGIQRLAEKILHNPLFIRAKQKEKVNLDIEQFYYMIREEERDAALIRLIDHENPAKAIIFCKTKRDVDRLTQFFNDSGYPARGLHGDMEQRQREEVMRNFRSEHLRLLVATDVAARGLSVTGVTHVFNYQLPSDPNVYLHRIGRTGRAGEKGVANSLLTSREWRDFQRFEKTLGTKILRGDIPTLGQVKNSKQRHMMDKILAQGIHEEAETFWKLLSAAEPKTIGLKLISALLKHQEAKGPDRIGLPSYQEEPRRSSGSFSTRRPASRHSRSR